MPGQSQNLIFAGHLVGSVERVRHLDLGGTGRTLGPCRQLIGPEELLSSSIGLTTFVAGRDKLFLLTQPWRVFRFFAFVSLSCCQAAPSRFQRAQIHLRSAPLGQKAWPWREPPPLPLLLPAPPAKELLPARTPSAASSELPPAPSAASSKLLPAPSELAASSELANSSLPLSLPGEPAQAPQAPAASGGSTPSWRPSRP